MALTREQFDALRTKGLSVEQIVKFEKGEAPKPKGFIDSVKESVANRVGDAKEAITSGEMNPLSVGLQFWGAGAGLVNDVIGAGIQKAVPGVTEKIGNVAKNVAETKPAQNILSSYEDFKAKHPEAAKDLESATNILSLMPVGKAVSAGGKAVKAGAEVAGESVKPIVGKTLSTAGAITEKAGNRATSVLFPPNESQIAKLTAYKAKNPLLKRVADSAKGIDNAPVTPSQVALKYNIVGFSRTEMAAKAKRITDKLWQNQVNPVLDGIKERVSKKDLFSKVEKSINKMPEVSERKAMLTALEAVKDDYKYINDFSYKKLDQIKSSFASKLPNKVWKGEDISGSLNNVRRVISSKAREIVRNKLPEHVKQIYDEYGSLLEIQKVGNKAYQQGSFKSGWLGMSSELLRTTGTPISTLGGKALDITGKTLKKVGQKLQK
jgi:hypothetical protein